MIKYIFLLIPLILPLPSIASSFPQFVIVPNNNILNNESYAGMIYYEKSINENPAVICSQKQKSPNIFHMIDQEGGSVLRIKGNLESPPNPSLANKMSIEDFYDKVNKAAISLKKYCINVNLAPIADTNYVDNAFGRAYDINPIIVSEYAQQFANAMRNNGITPTWKHFPGYSLNSDNPSEKDKKYLNEFESGYKELIINRASKKEIYANMQAFKNEHYDLLMLNIGIFPAISPIPVLLNQEIINKAHELQPNSLLITDDISFLKLTDEKLLFLFKNVDLFLFSGLQNAEDFIKKLDLLKSKGLITENDIKTKIDRINNWKKNQK